MLGAAKLVASNRSPQSDALGSVCLQLRASGLFEGVSELEDTGFTEGRAEDLEADGKVFLGCFAARYRDSGHSCEGACHGVDVGEVHLKWVVGFFPEFKGRNGGSGSDDGVDFGKGVPEILCDE